MSIIFSKNAPSNGTDLVAQHMAQHEIQSKRGLLEARESDNISVGNAIQLWTINADDYKKPIHEAFTPGHWQYLVFDKDEVISASYLADSSQEGVHAKSYGTLVEGVLEGLHGAEAFSKDTDDSFEPRLIVIPSVHFTGLWLSHTENDTTKDVVLPIPPHSFSQLEHLKPISLDQLGEHITNAFNNMHDQIKKNPGDSAGSGSIAAPFGQSISGKTGIPSLLAVNNVSSLLKAAGGAPAGGASTVQLSFTMQHQLEANWCWAACGTSVGLFYGTGNWTQCDTATGCLPGQNCCANAGSCNVYGYLNKALTYTRSFNHTADGTCPPNTVRAQLNNGNSVCTRVAWNGGGAHFMAITGIDSSNKLTIQDSIYGTTRINYNSYPGAYHGGGTWTTTYYCMKN